MPDWPPADFDWDAELKKRRLRRVALDDWEDAEDVSSDGLTKVYEISHYKGEKW